MRRSIIVTLSLLGLGAFVFGMAMAAHSQQASAASQPTFTYSVANIADAPVAQTVNQHLTASAEPTGVDADTAVSAVRTRFAAALLGSATSVVVGKYRLTDDIIDESIVPKNALVWVVSLNGVKLPLLGRSFEPAAGAKKPGVFHQLNIVIDATTGAPLESYSGAFGPE